MFFRDIDFHVHSELSGEEQCRGFTIKQIYECAQKYGIKRLGLCDHWMNKKRRPTWHTRKDIFCEASRDIEEYSDQFRTEIFLSAEIEVCDSEGNLACDLEDALEILDYTSASVHYADEPRFEDMKGSRAVQRVLEISLALVQNPRIDVLLHPELLTVAAREGVAFPKSWYEELAQAAAQGGTALQLTNISVATSPLIRERYFPGVNPAEIFEHYETLLRSIKKYSTPFTLGSDAHNEYRPFEPSVRWFGSDAETIGLLNKLNMDRRLLWMPRKRDKRSA